MSRFADTPAPPYYAVIFANQRTGLDEKGYAETAARMEHLARDMPGFLGIESTRDDSGFGITVSYWQSEQAIADWKKNIEHSAARARGRGEWYEHYELRVARVERAYGGPAKSKDREG